MPEGGPEARRFRHAAGLLLQPRRLWRKHRRVAIGLIAVVVVIAGIVIAYNALKRPADVHNPNAASPSSATAASQRLRVDEFRRMPGY